MPLGMVTLWQLHGQAAAKGEDMVAIQPGQLITLLAVVGVIAAVAVAVVLATKKK